MTPKEVQELRPGPYIIYFNPEKTEGYGVYRKDRVWSRIKEQRLDESLTKIIEEHTCILKASQREIELQVSNGYTPNIIPYWKTLSAAIIGAERSKGLKRYVSDETKKRLSEVHKKLVPLRTPKHKRLLKEANEKRKKKVGKFTLQGEFIQSYESLTQAGRVNNIPSTQIKDNCSGRQKTCHGFIWKFLGK